MWGFFFVCEEGEDAREDARDDAPEDARDVAGLKALGGGGGGGGGGCPKGFCRGDNSARGFLTTPGESTFLFIDAAACTLECGVAPEGV